MCFSYISIYLHTGENASYLSLCLCTYIFHRKIKCKMNLNLKVKWCLVAAWLLVFCYSIEMILLFFAPYELMR